MKVLKDFKNDLLSRREIKAVMTSEKNPTKEECAAKLAEHFKSHADHVVVNRIGGKFGRKTFLIDASIYSSKETKEKIEPKPKVKKVAGEAPAA